MDEEVIEKTRAVLTAIRELDEALTDAGAGEELLDACALASEAMENLACDLGYGVMNGVMVPR